MDVSLVVLLVAIWTVWIVLKILLDTAFAEWRTTVVTFDGIPQNIATNLANAVHSDRLRNSSAWMQQHLSCTHKLSCEHYFCINHLLVRSVFTT